jgi:hypothetical protein
MFLYTRQEHRAAFIDFEREVITDPDGQTIAFLEGDGIFDRAGLQVGWWMGSYICDLVGRVLLVTAEAFIAGMALPRPTRSSQRPTRREIPNRPGLQRINSRRPPRRAEWGKAKAFLGRLATAGIISARNGNSKRTCQRNSDMAPVLRSIGALP